MMNFKLAKWRITSAENTLRFLQMLISKSSMKIYLNLGTPPSTISWQVKLNLCASYHCTAHFILFKFIFSSDVLSIWHLMLFQNTDSYFILQNITNLPSFLAELYFFVEEISQAYWGLDLTV